MPVKPDQQAASDDDPQKDSRSDAPEVKAPSMLDAVREAKGREGAAGDGTKSNDKPTPPASKDDDGKGGSKDKPESDKGKGGDEEPEGGWIPDSELIGKDLRNVDLKRVRPELRTTVTKMQRAERDKHAKLNALIAEAEKNAKPNGRGRDEKDDPDEDENPYLDDVRSALKTKKGRELLREVLKEEGLDLQKAADVVNETAGDRVLQLGLNSATEKYPDLTKKDFFDEVVKTIADDEDLTDDFEAAEKSNDSKAFARVFKAAAREVKSAREEAERKRVAKEKADAKADRDTKLVDNPGSRAAKAGRKPGAPDGPLTTLERVKQVREQLASS